MRPLLLLVLASALLCGCGPTTVTSLVREHGAKQLAARDLLTLVRGNTLRLRAYNEEVALYFDPAGRVYGRDQYADRDAGRWQVSEGGELCLRMESWWYGDLRCLEAYRPAAGVIRFSGAQQTGDSQSLAVAGERMERRRPLRATADQLAGSLPEEEKQPADRAVAAPPVVEERTQPAADARDTSVTVEFLARDCPGCNLAGADLGKAELAGAKLAGADLHGANLSMANLRRADLQKANLQGATLVYANLPGADLRGADLRGARLKGANLIKADLTGARLEGADLSETLRDGARGLPPVHTP
jgi:hypothetical protein